MSVGGEPANDCGGCADCSTAGSGLGGRPSRINKAKGCGKNALTKSAAAFFRFLGL